jgi:hypothetical protein
MGNRIKNGIGPSEEAGYDQRGHERKESGNDIEKESTLHTNSLSFILLTAKTCHELRG